MNTQEPVKTVKTQHTPGPWIAGFNHGNESREVDIETDLLCVASVMPMSDDDEQCANAKLIAAAPELLEACKSALEVCDYSDVREMLTSVIARATT